MFPASDPLANTPPARMVFPTTRWSMVLRAAHADSPEADDALEKLCRTYWVPLYAYVRRRGYESPDAQDLTQEFFARFLARNYVTQADRDKGRFRSFLLGSMNHFLANEWDRAQARKRGGGCTFLAWDEFDEGQYLQFGSHRTPDQIYERQWAMTLLDRVLAQLRDECAAAGKGELFNALRPYLSGEKAATPYEQVARPLNLTSGAVQVAVHRLRQRYGELLRSEIAHTVGHAGDVDDELRHLRTILRG